ncbi:pyruvate kinase [Manduca sexta]|uniref:pyruvate kinase n=1 Tax=Manduca sexta TaxID=7130 RepID=UPI001183AE85|nr:pyruvate kinase [Manduca sexta]
MSAPIPTDGRHHIDICRAELASLKKKYEKPYRLTRFIVTFCEGTLTSIDMKSLIELGLSIVRFKMSYMFKSDRVKMMLMLQTATRWCCQKYEVNSWPIAISIDIPNACIRTGYIDDAIPEPYVILKEGSIVEVTSDVKFWNKCTAHRIFMDDPYTIKTIKRGAEFTLNFGLIVMFCTEVINAKTLKCKIARGGELKSCVFVCIRGCKLTRPPLTKNDMELLSFAKNYKLDMVTLNSVRNPKTLVKLKDFFKDAPYMPLIISSICDQEGLDNIDEIIENSDGIILAREFLAFNIVNMYQMISIQLMIGAKCRKMGKPFYLSGHILEQTMLEGTISGCDLNDITNAVLQGAGFVLRSYYDPSNLIKTMKILDSVCRCVEPLSTDNDFMRISMEFKMPVNAAEACILSCALLARQSNSLVVIVPTVTGRTAKQLTRIAPQSIILTVSSNPVVARQLQFYRGIIPIIYEQKQSKNWQEEMDRRVQFAVSYGLRQDLLKYGHTYVALKKSSPTSSYCDHLSVWHVMTEETKKRKIQCPDFVPHEKIY